MRFWNQLRDRGGQITLLFAGWMLAAAMLLPMCRIVPRPAPLAQRELGQRFASFVSASAGDALDGILAVKRIYWIEEGAPSAPKPNPDAFGQSRDRAELARVVADAKPLLDGQKLYFRPGLSLLEGSCVEYYRDETILALNWKQEIQGGVYTFCEIKIDHPSQFRRFLAGGEFGSEKLFFTTEMASAVQAVAASSGDFYRFRQAGILVNGGKVNRAHGWALDTCYVDREGDLHFSSASEPMTAEQAQAFVEEKDIRFSLAFGPILIQNRELTVPGWYSVGEINDEYPRAALCQLGKLHYLLVMVNQEAGFNHMPTIRRFAENLLATGCIHAYALDGGQTASMTMGDRLVNSVMFGSQRKISDIIYFATAIPPQLNET